MLVIVTIAALAAWDRRELSYQGKPASCWLDHFSSPWEGTNLPLLAFQAMGSNAVPYLIRVLETKPSALGKKLDAELYGISGRGQNLPERFKQRLPSAMRMEDRREHAAFILSELGPVAEAAIPALVRIIEDPNEGWRLTGEARRALFSMGEKLASQTPRFMEYIKRGGVEARGLGARYLGSIGPKAKQAIPLLLETVDGDDSRIVRWAAASALWKIDRQTNVALRVFAANMDGTNRIRPTAFSYLAEMGPAAKPAAPAIAAWLEDDDESARDSAVKTLEAVDPDLLEARLRELNHRKVGTLARLIKIIRTGDYPECRRAIEAITMFGPEAKEAVPALIDALDKPRQFITDIHAVSSQQRLWWVVADALGEIGPDASAAVPKLIALIHKNKAYAAAAYCPALGKMRTNAEAAVPVLQGLLDEGNPRLRLAAADALTKVAPQACSNVVAVLTNLQHDSESATVWVSDGHGATSPTDKKDFENSECVFLRLSASVALWRLGVQKQPPVAALTELVDEHPAHTGSLWAVTLLGEIGPPAKSSLPALRAVLDQKTTLHSRVAATAIRKIDPDEWTRLGLPGMLALP